MNVKKLSRNGAVTILGMLCVLLGCTKKTAQEEGAELAGEKIDMAAGVGDALQAKGGKAGEALAAGVGTLIKGVERGVLKSGRDVAADPSLKAAGLSVTNVQDATAKEENNAHALDAYIVAATPAKGRLRMFVYDALGNEMGRSSIAVDLGADSAAYHTFLLHQQVDLSKVSKVRFAFNAG